MERLSSDPGRFPKMTLLHYGDIAGLQTLVLDTLSIADGGPVSFLRPPTGVRGTEVGPTMQIRAGPPTIQIPTPCYSWGPIIEVVGQ
jgi:hypothetical protein